MGEYSTKLLEQRCMGLETLFSNLQVEYKKLQDKYDKLVAATSAKPEVKKPIRKEIANGKSQTRKKPSKG